MVEVIKYNYSHEDDRPGKYSELSPKEIEDLIKEEEEKIINLKNN